MISSPSVPLLEPQLEVPEDPNLPELAQLFDRDWVLGVFRQQLNGNLAGPPHRFRVRQFVHSPGRTAFTRYEVEWPPDAFLAPQHLVIRLDCDQPSECYLYPDDRRLPGLREAADVGLALRLVNKHVLSMPARRARVDLVRYRPGYRAVLRHKVGRVKLYARVARPEDFPRLLAAYEITILSGFVIPNLAGYWKEGGVIWLSEVSGRNTRLRIRKGKLPDPDLLLDGLDKLWQRASDLPGGRPFRLASAYRNAKRSFRHNLRDSGAGVQSLNEAVRSLDPFVQSWSPSCIAHNDFYDDQMLVMQDGKIALVDFEEAGPGDPMLDIGNFLAHLLWSSQFGSAKSAVACQRYYEVLRSRALERFNWDERSLTYREAVCLFRVCTNVIRHPQENGLAKLETGLGLVNDVLG